MILSHSTSRILLQLRAPDKNDNSYWGFWGGTSENGESVIDTIRREMEEEIGFMPETIKNYPIHKLVSNDKKFEYYTYLVTVEDEFLPTLNYESVGYAWTPYDMTPSPLHPGAKVVLYNPKILSKIRAIIDQQTFQFA